MPLVFEHSEALQIVWCLLGKHLTPFGLGLVSLEKACLAFSLVPEPLQMDTLVYCSPKHEALKLCSSFSIIKAYMASALPFVDPWVMSEEGEVFVPIPLFPPVCRDLTGGAARRLKSQRARLLFQSWDKGK